MRLESELSIRVLTHNIRYATSAPFYGEEPWTVRAPRLITELRFSTSHCPEAFICLQEVLDQQLLDIADGLNEGCEKSVKWEYVGVGRDDGKQAGEYSPIFYQPAVWTLQKFKTVWLSETPDRPSKGWDAASTRILTIGLFQHRQCKRRVVAMNTHLDDQGSRSRLEAAKIILDQVAEFSENGKLPVFLAGDFNSEPDQEAYLAVTKDSSPMADLFGLLSPENRYGHFHTFSGFGHGPAPTRIDFLFFNRNKNSQQEAVLTKEHWLIKGYGVLENCFDDKVYISDHRAVVGDVALQ